MREAGTRVETIQAERNIDSRREDDKEACTLRKRGSKIREKTNSQVEVKKVENAKEVKVQVTNNTKKEKNLDQGTASQNIKLWLAKRKCNELVKRKGNIWSREVGTLSAKKNVNKKEANLGDFLLEQLPLARQKRKKKKRNQCIQLINQTLKFRRESSSPAA